MQDGCRCDAGDPARFLSASSMPRSVSSDPSTGICPAANCSPWSTPWWRAPRTSRTLMCSGRGDVFGFRRTESWFRRRSDVLVRLPVRSCPPAKRGARRGAWSGLVPRGRTSPWRSGRTRVFSVPGRLVSRSRTPTLRNPPEWPWTDASSRPRLPTMPPTRTL